MATAKKKKAAPRKKAPIATKRKRTPRTKAAKYMKQAQQQFSLELGKLETSRILATTKRDKNKLGKKILELKSQIRKLAR